MKLCDQHLVHAADGLEAVQVVLARLQLDVPRLAGEPRAQRMDALAAGVEQPCHRVLRQPVDLQIGVQLAQLARDGDVAPAVPQADRRGEVERLLCLARGRRPLLAGRRNAEPAIEEIVDQIVALGRKASERIVPAARNGEQLRSRQLGHHLGARMGLDLVVVAVDQQQWAADLAIHALAHVEVRRDRPCLDGLDQHGTLRFARPLDAVLDLPGGVRLGADVADEMLGEVGVLGEPVGAIVFVPAFEPIALGNEMLWRHVGIAGADGGHGADQDRGLHALGVVGGEHGGVQAAERQADQYGLAGIRRVHDGECVGHEVVERIGGRIHRLVGLAVAAWIEGDAAEALAEVGQLRLVDARVHDAPRRQEHHRLGPVAIDLVVDLDAVALGKAVLARQFCAHHITSP